MSIDAQQVLEQALTLPAIDRAAIVESLLSSLDEPDARVDEAWAEEAERRIAAFDAGQMKALPVGEVFKEFDNLWRSDSSKPRAMISTMPSTITRLNVGGSGPHSAMRSA